jgi:hypothetical protein
MNRYVDICDHSPTGYAWWVPENGHILPGCTCQPAELNEDQAFRAWVQTLKEDVIQEEYGYEPGEFDVFPELWHGLYREGLTPSQAFKRALDDRTKERKSEEESARLDRTPTPYEDR